ncbi:MAG: 5-formyltetrahydrofolate cyclo-ligase [Kangiellaceae bacterium]|jgi:5-formyltetrahydrofolate cyclo-ligase
MNNKITKSQIRQRIRLDRNLLSELDVAGAGEQLSAQLSKHLIIQQGKKVGCFLSFDGEICTKQTLSLINQLGAHCYLPKLRPYKPNRLWFMPYDSSVPMTNNRFGIAEVNLPVSQAIAVSKLDVVLLPLVAFDLKGNRLGMGGGFYDATFSHLRSNKNRPAFIGLAYELQKLESLPSDSWDLPLDGVCTESGFYQFTR